MYKGGCARNETIFHLRYLLLFVFQINIDTIVAYPKWCQDKIMIYFLLGYLFWIISRLGQAEQGLLRTTPHRECGGGENEQWWGQAGRKQKIIHKELNEDLWWKCNTKEGTKAQ